MVSTPDEFHLRRKALQRELLAWYGKRGRMFPWRVGKTRWGRDPYRVLVSEVMLQQTQVERVIPYYQRWMRRWPTIFHLARARRSSLIKAWGGLGYNRRAVQLHKAAQAIVSSFVGAFPKTERALMKLPGVGRYTARAILAFAYGEDVGVLETNTKRVLLRVFLGVSSLGELGILFEQRGRVTLSEPDLVRLADSVVPRGRGDVWNQAMMDFGALVCTAKRPKCGECPLQTVCVWYRNQTQNAKLPIAEQARYGAGKTQNYSAKVKTFREKRVKFEETDRYFRGRIVAMAREGPVERQRLSRLMAKEYGLSDKRRLTRLVTGLVADGLLAVSGDSITLP